MKRRQLLYGLLGIAAWPKLSFALGSTTTAHGHAGSDLADCLLQACPRRFSAGFVGNAYLSGFRSPPKASQTIDHLLDKLDIPRSDLATMAPAKLKARIRSRMTDDFSAGRTVGLHGWVLSETEVELCSLAALRY
ncbi:MAG: hypothetical protein ACR2QF_04615 [Geminicoccaceae bacterium]